MNQHLLALRYGPPLTVAVDGTRGAHDHFEKTLLLLKNTKYHKYSYFCGNVDQVKTAHARSRWLSGGGQLERLRADNDVNSNV